MKQKLLFLLLVFPILTYSQESLKEYVHNEFNFRHLIDFSNKGNVDSTNFYALKIINSKDKTFLPETYYRLAILHNNKVKACANLLVLPATSNLGNYFECKHEHKNKSLNYLDKAVRFGLVFSDIKLEYDSLRYEKNRKFYESTYYNKELIDLLSLLSVSDQNNRVKYNKRKISWDVVAKQDSINCSKLKDWVNNNGWPKFLSQRDISMIDYDYESSSVSEFISHFGRENLLFFLDKAYESAKIWESSWNQVYEILMYQYWKFPEQRLILDEDKRFYVSLSPLNYIYVDELTGIIDVENSMFEILGIAECAQYDKVLILPTKKYYSTHRKNAFRELFRINNICSKFGVSAFYFPIFQSGWQEKIKQIIEAENYESEFYIILFPSKSSAYFIDRICPTILSKSKITEQDFNSIFKL